MVAMKELKGGKKVGIREGKRGGFDKLGGEGGGDQGPRIS